MLRSLLFVAIALGIILAIIAVVSMVAATLHRRRLMAVAATREGVASWAHFQADFPDWPEDLLATLYKHIIHLGGVSDFPLLPDDDLFELLDIDQGDLEDMLETELAKAGIDVAAFQGKMPDQPIQTVRDMLNWVNVLIQNKDTPDGPPVSTG